MGNSLWNKLNNKNKSKKSNYEISKKTNIPEDKVKEIMNGERTIPTDRVDDFVGAIQENNTLERSVNAETAKRWIMETDLKELRKKFNYSSQVELAKELGLDTSTVCRLENKKFSHTSDSTLIKYYDFFQDELNIKVKRDGGKKRTRFKPKRKDKEVLGGINAEEAMAWYKSFDLKEYLRVNGLSYKEFSLLLGYSARSTSLISNLVNRKVEETPTGCTVILKAYAYVNGLMKPQETTIEEETSENEELVEEITNEAQEPNNDTMKKDSDTSMSLKDSDISMSLSDYIATPSIEEIPISTPKYIEEPVENKHNTSTKDYDSLVSYVEYAETLEQELAKTKEELERYKLQVARYEKLIDMIER